MRRSRRLVSLLTLLTAFTFVAAACGDDSGSSVQHGRRCRDHGGGAATTAGGAATTGASGEALPACGGTKDVKGTADNTLETRTLTRRAASTRRSACCSTSPAAATSRSTTPPAPGSTRPRPTSASRPPSRRRRATRTARPPRRLLGELGQRPDHRRRLPLGRRHHRRSPRRTTRASTSASSTSVVDAARTCASMTFAEEQGSFLVGAAAAMQDARPASIGFIGGVENDLIKKFEAGYTAGAKQINPDVTVDVKYITPAAGLHRLQRPGQGQGDRRGHVRRRRSTSSTPPPAARARACSRPPRSTPTPSNTHVWAIGVDSDQYLTVGADLAAVHPHLDAEAGRRRRVRDDQRLPQRQAPRWARRGVRPQGRRRRLLDDRRQLEDITSKLEDLKQQIIDGKITVPTAP